MGNPPDRPKPRPLPGVGALDALAAAAAAQLPPRRRLGESASALSAIADAAAAQVREHPQAHSLGPLPRHDESLASAHGEVRQNHFALPSWTPRTALPSVNSLPSMPYDAGASGSWGHSLAGGLHQSPVAQVRGQGSQHPEMRPMPMQPLTPEHAMPAEGRGSHPRSSVERAQFSAPAGPSLRDDPRGLSYVLDSARTHSVPVAMDHDGRFGAPEPWSRASLSSHTSAAYPTYPEVRPLQNVPTHSQVGEYYYPPMSAAGGGEASVIRLPPVRVPGNEPVLNEPLTGIQPMRRNQPDRFGEHIESTRGGSIGRKSVQGNMHLPRHEVSNPVSLRPQGLSDSELTHGERSNAVGIQQCVPTTVTRHESSCLPPLASARGTPDSSAPVPGKIYGVPLVSGEREPPRTVPRIAPAAPLEALADLALSGRAQDCGVSSYPSPQDSLSIHGEHAKDTRAAAEYASTRVPGPPETPFESRKGISRTGPLPTPVHAIDRVPTKRIPMTPRLVGACSDGPLGEDGRISVVHEHTVSPSIHRGPLSRDMRPVLPRPDALGRPHPPHHPRGADRLELGGQNVVRPGKIEARGLEAEALRTRTGHLEHRTAPLVDGIPPGRFAGPGTGVIRPVSPSLGIHVSDGTTHDQAVLRQSTFRSSGYERLSGIKVEGSKLGRAKRGDPVVSSNAGSVGVVSNGTVLDGKGTTPSVCPVQSEKEVSGVLSSSTDSRKGPVRARSPRQRSSSMPASESADPRMPSRLPDVGVRDTSTSVALQYHGKATDPVSECQDVLPRVAHPGTLDQSNDCPASSRTVSHLRDVDKSLPPSQPERVGRSATKDMANERDPDHTQLAGALPKTSETPVTPTLQLLDEPRHSTSPRPSNTPEERDPGRVGHQPEKVVLPPLAGVPHSLDLSEPGHMANRERVVYPSRSLHPNRAQHLSSPRTPSLVDQSREGSILTKDAVLTSHMEPQSTTHLPSSAPPRNAPVLRRKTPSPKIPQSSSSAQNRPSSPNRRPDVVRKSSVSSVSPSHREGKLQAHHPSHNPSQVALGESVQSGQRSDPERPPPTGICGGNLQSIPSLGRRTEVPHVLFREPRALPEHQGAVTRAPPLQENGPEMESARRSVYGPLQKCERDGGSVDDGAGVEMKNVSMSKDLQFGRAESSGPALLDVNEQVSTLSLKPRSSFLGDETPRSGGAPRSPRLGAGFSAHESASKSMQVSRPDSKSAPSHSRISEQSPRRRPDDDSEAVRNYSPRVSFGDGDKSPLSDGAMPARTDKTHVIQAGTVPYRTGKDPDQGGPAKLEGGFPGVSYAAQTTSPKKAGPDGLGRKGAEFIEGVNGQPGVADVPKIANESVSELSGPGPASMLNPTPTSLSKSNHLSLPKPIVVDAPHDAPCNVPNSSRSPIIKAVAVPSLRAEDGRLEDIRSSDSKRHLTSDLEQNVNHHSSRKRSQSDLTGVSKGPMAVSMDHASPLKYSSSGDHDAGKREGKTDVEQVSKGLGRELDGDIAFSTDVSTKTNRDIVVEPRPSTEVKERKKAKSKNREKRKSRSKDQSTSQGGEITRCPCGSSENLDEMVACDECNTWQHMKCMGIRDRFEVAENAKYFCHICRPDEVRPNCIAHSKFRQVAREKDRVSKEVDLSLSAVKPLELRRLFSLDLKSRRRDSTALDHDDMFRRYAGLFRTQFGKDKQSVIEGLVLVTEMPRVEVSSRLEHMLKKLRGTGSRPSPHETFASADADSKVWNSVGSRSQTPVAGTAALPDPNPFARPPRETGSANGGDEIFDDMDDAAPVDMQEVTGKAKRLHSKGGMKRPRPLSLQSTGTVSGGDDATTDVDGQSDPALVEALSSGRALSREDRKNRDVLRVFEKMAGRIVRGKKRPRTSGSAHSPKETNAESPSRRPLRQDSPNAHEPDAKYPGDVASVSPKQHDRDTRVREKHSEDASSPFGLARKTESKSPAPSPVSEQVVLKSCAVIEGSGDVGSSRRRGSAVKDVDTEATRCEALSLRNTTKSSSDDMLSRKLVQGIEEPVSRRKSEKEKQNRERLAAAPARERPRRRHGEPLVSPRVGPPVLSSAKKSSGKSQHGQAPKFSRGSIEFEPFLRLLAPGACVLRSDVVPRLRRSAIENEFTDEERRKGSQSLSVVGPRKRLLQAAVKEEVREAAFRKCLPFKKKRCALSSEDGEPSMLSMFESAAVLAGDPVREGMGVSMVLVSHRDSLPDGGLRLDSSRVEHSGSGPHFDALPEVVVRDRIPSSDAEAMSEYVRRAVVERRTGASSKCVKKRFGMFYVNEKASIGTLHGSANLGLELKSKSPILNLRSAPFCENTLAEGVIGKDSSFRSPKAMFPEGPQGIRKTRLGGPSGSPAARPQRLGAANRLGDVGHNAKVKLGLGLRSAPLPEAPKCRVSSKDPSTSAVDNSKGQWNHVNADNTVASPKPTQGPRGSPIRDKQSGRGQDVLGKTADLPVSLGTPRMKIPTMRFRSVPQKLPTLSPTNGGKSDGRDATPQETDRSGKEDKRSRFRLADFVKSARVEPSAVSEQSHLRETPHTFRVGDRVGPKSHRHAGSASRAQSKSVSKFDKSEKDSDRR